MEQITFATPADKFVEYFGGSAVWVHRRPVYEHIECMGPNSIFAYATDPDPKFSGFVDNYEFADNPDGWDQVRFSNSRQSVIVSEENTQNLAYFLGMSVESLSRRMLLHAGDHQQAVYVRWRGGGVILASLNREWCGQ